MTQIEKIRQEIERRAELNTTQFKKGLISVETLTARDSQLLGLNTFLDTLSVDAPEGLDEAAKAYEDGLGYYECMNQWPSVAFKAGAEWAFGQFEPVGTFPVEDARGGYWPTEYFVRKK